MVSGLAEQLRGEDELIQMDESQWPVLIVTPPRTVSDEQMAEFLGRHRALERQRAQDYVIVLDLRNTGKLTPGQRELLTEGMAGDESETWLRGLAMVFESRVLRGVLSMIFWVRKPPYPTRVFATPMEALPWARETLDHFRRQRPENFFVQCDATRDRARAREVLTVLESYGHSAAILELEVGGKLMYVPRIGPLGERSEALSAAEALEQAGISTRLVNE